MLIPNRHFSPFKLFLDKPTRTAVMLNPKVLTTFTRHFLTDGFAQHHGRTDPSEGRYRLLSVPRRFPVAPLTHFAGFIADPGRYALYALVRNPYGRLLSAWRNKFLDGHSRSPDHSDAAYSRGIRRNELQPLRRYAATHGLPGGAPATLIPFSTFLAYVASHPPGQRDHHWDAQTRVLMTDRLRYTRIWRIEDELPEGFLTLGQRLSFPETWIRHRLETPVNPSKGRASSYTPELATLAQRIIAEDLAHFGYSADSWQDY
ncbi:sulfotransferase family 2 domain-containing protein [Fertoebacter nigrum]|uniref:Sulfotransferase family 2 domain-containing protein n=1 Tax=Fertoeibacter niger TaxID=2656921 RepID=A0A8X8H319_9RHOB|nr:sulfotransferase family 2 domain-containing protein [Fertoeibacter niger]NUB46406.1 sulfotransferase family 2 domain-containing protein [Fertoeibacter niger]